MNNMLQKIFGQIQTEEEFNALRITIASPDEIIGWSKGEVKKPETINYNTFKPEPDGLFCPKIFGPTKDYECSCGKYKKIKSRGIVCEKCGTEVCLSSVRRERMGHIKLATPVAHIWFLKEGKIATLLNNMPAKKLEQVIYYDAYVVSEPGLTDLKLYDVISEEEFEKKQAEFGPESFRAEMGADAIKNILASIDLRDEKAHLRKELSETKSEAKKSKIVKQLKLVESFLDSKTEPRWMVMEVLPVLPPELRPLVQLEAGRVANSDLNDLYRRVIIRNNRLKKLIDMRVPELIVRNEKRMLQEAVDALFDNSRKLRPMVGPNKRPLKSLSDILRGKQGRFRQNMLAKRVDFSGRSVIVSGPKLKLHQVGLPKMMALELFKPFVYSKLLQGEYANTLKTARKMVENQEPIVWDMLEDVIYQHPVLLNRAPTLHRLSILAFEPILIEGKAIQLHPLVCGGFNADFDGDQMAVHVPISLEAQLEARTLMLSTNNILSPANAEPMITPTQDMVLGVYYLSLVEGDLNVKNDDDTKIFANLDEIKLALDNDTLKLHEPIVTKFRGKTVKTTAGRMIIGELLPEGLDFIYVNKIMTKGAIKSLLSKAYEKCGDKACIVLADRIKNLGFEYGARSGISFCQDDILIPDEKAKIISESDKQVANIEDQYQNGLISRGEKYNKVIDLWDKTTKKISDLAMAKLSKGNGNTWNSIYMMADSGARGSKTQIQQLAGMRGSMAKPNGDIIEVPITSNFKEGLTTSEYFTSTHGARKGLADTAMKTADAGYLTRRLVMVAQNTFITEEDCGTHKFITATPVYDGSVEIESIGSVVLGRTAAHDVINPVDGSIVIPANTIITKQLADKLNDLKIQSVDIRSVLTCEAGKDGLCAKCYGLDLSRNNIVQVGDPVGVIAAQSIGEPGTQLTLRTFHVGGIAAGGSEKASLESNHEGIAKFNEKSILTNSIGRQIVMSRSCDLFVTDKKGKEIAKYRLPYASSLLVKNGEEIKRGDKLAEWDPYSNMIIAEYDGTIKLNDLVENVSYSDETDAVTGLVSRRIIDWKSLTKKTLKPSITILDKDGEIIKSGKKTAEYILPIRAILSVSDGDKINAGDIIARIPIDTVKTKDITGGLPRVEELFEARNPKNPAIIAEKDGEIEIEDTQRTKILVRIIPEDGSDVVEYHIPKGENLQVAHGDMVKKGDFIVDGTPVANDVLRILGPVALSNFIVDQVQQVYRLQGVTINNKHMEIIVRQMMKKVEILTPNDTTFLTGQIVDRYELEEENEKTEKEGGKPAEFKPILLGISKVSSKTSSFLANASFQETPKALTEAAIAGATDHLTGMSENITVGRLIPVGTGAYVQRIRKQAHDEENAEIEEESKQISLKI